MHLFCTHCSVPGVKPLGKILDVTYSAILAWLDNTTPSLREMQTAVLP
jgi:hypothetical protein